jgi:hypothetical protein
MKQKVRCYHVAVKRGPSLATKHSSPKYSIGIASRQLHFSSISLAYAASVSRLRSPSLRFAEEPVRSHGLMEARAVSQQCTFKAAGTPRCRVPPNRLRARPLAVARPAINASSPTASVADPPVLPRADTVKQAVNRPQKVGATALSAPSRQSGGTNWQVPWPRKRQAGGALCAAALCWHQSLAPWPHWPGIHSAG